jgi:tetratricopeptide (TPR) repeat protein
MRSALVLTLVGLAGACGEEPRASAPSPARLPAHPAADPAFGEVRAALEGERGDLALTLLERVEGFEAECLRARAELLVGDSVAALATLERARAADPRDAELASTEVELYARLGRTAAAQERLAAALQRLGPTPELLRAQGVVELGVQGHAEAALTALERARARAPELPFLSVPLAQAHLLVGRARLEKAPAEATAHALAAKSLGGEPLREEAIELEAEGLTGELRFEEALERYAELEARGKDLGETPATLHQRAATRCLLEHDREGALQHYLLARARGLSDEALGFGLDVLQEEGRREMERGLEAVAEERWEAAKSAFERARELLPDDPEVENHLGLARFQAGDYAGAAAAWESALRTAARIGHRFADPLELDLARAQRLSGASEKARAVLSRLLDAAPDGPWSAQAREMLLALEAEALSGGPR